MSFATLYCNFLITLSEIHNFECQIFGDYTRKIAQVVIQICKRVVTGGRQTDIRMCSHGLFPVDVTILEQVVITLLQG